MPTFTTDLLEYATLAHRILRDELPTKKLDAACFFGQTHENDRVALETISINYSGLPILVGKCDTIQKENRLLVRGHHAWQGYLEGRGCKNVVIYPMSDKLPPSTDAEALGMVPIIKKRSWKRLVIVVPPLHAIRAFVSLISACLKNNLNHIAIWSAPCDALAWNENVFHSGSMPAAPREKQIQGELDKIMRYCEKGDYLTAKEILDYLRTKDVINSKIETAENRD